MNDQGTELPLPEDRKGREPKEYPLVDMGMGRMGFEMTDLDEELDLAAMFDLDPDRPDLFTEVFLTTDDGNIFRVSADQVEESADLTNAAESRKAGGHLSVISVHEPLEVGLKATVGKPFQFGDYSTPPVVKISAVNGKSIHTPEVIDKNTQGRKSTITADFKTACLPIGAEQS